MSFNYKVIAPCAYAGCYRTPIKHNLVVTEKELDPVPSFLELESSDDSPVKTEEPINASAAAVKLAEAVGIDLEDVTPTGATGITKGDVQDFIEALDATFEDDD